jgi:hypothetical protein
MKERIFISSVILVGAITSILSFKHIHVQKSPNIHLITAGALCLDHLSSYGYERNTSLNIDKLAKERIRFTQAIYPGR